MSQTKVTDNLRDTTAIDATKISGAVPSASLTNVDLSKLEYNQAILAFKVASANQLAKFSMVDQVIDEYQDTTGIDAGASTNETAAGVTTAKYYHGQSVGTPTVSVTGTGNTSVVDGDYTVHTFITSGDYITDSAQDVEYMVVGGGGGGGGAMSSYVNAGGGGAGGYKAATGFATVASTIAVTVGLGGAGGTGNSGGTIGGDSIFSTITVDGGGGGGSYSGGEGNGGSGGGGAANGRPGGLGNTGDGGSGQGNNGGTGAAYVGSTSTNGAGGGGGSGGAGANASGVTAGAGGVGTQNDITGTSLYYAAGGGGAQQNSSGTQGAGGSSIGGAGAGPGAANGAAAPTANRGSGGGGSATATGSDATGGAGSKGIVVIRRLTSSSVDGGNLTLQSVATTAESAPTTADLVILIEDKYGTATINTDIKGYVSRNGSAFSTAVTFVDEGDWGTNKRILVARNIDISGITTGTSMKYKLTTHNQSAASKETYIHATSLAWA